MKQAFDIKKAPRPTKKVTRPQRQLPSGVFAYVHFRDEAGLEQGLLQPMQLFGVVSVANEAAGYEGRVCKTNPVEQDKAMLQIHSIPFGVTGAGLVDELQWTLGSDAPVRLSLADPSLADKVTSAGTCILNFVDGAGRSLGTQETGMAAAEQTLHAAAADTMAFLQVSAGGGGVEFAARGAALLRATLLSFFWLLNGR